MREVVSVCSESGMHLCFWGERDMRHAIIASSRHVLLWGVLQDTKRNGWRCWTPVMTTSERVVMRSVVTLWFTHLILCVDGVTWPQAGLLSLSLLKQTLLSLQQFLKVRFSFPRFRLQRIHDHRKDDDDDFTQQLLTVSRHATRHTFVDSYFSSFLGSPSSSD